MSTNLHPDPAKILPETIKVGPMLYYIMVGSDFKTEDGDELLGFADFTHRMICVDESLDPVVRWHVFLHELVHVVFFNLGLEQPDERMIDGLAYSILDVLLDNDLMALDQALPTLELECING